MFRVLTIILLGIWGMTGIGYSQEIPDGVKEYMDILQNDPTVEYGFNSAKEWSIIDQDVQFTDWYVGLPFRLYNLSMQSIEMATEDSKFEDLIRPTNRWCIPVKINGLGYTCHVMVTVEGKPIGCGQNVLVQGWDDVRKKFPEESGIVPGFVDYPYYLLYFPHIKNGRNIFHAAIPGWNDPMSKATSKSLDSLDDGNTIIPLLKDKVKSYREQSEALDQQKREYRKQIENSQDKSGGRK